MAGKIVRILCINCNICVNKLRRYPVMTLNNGVIALLFRWVYPQNITKDDVICETCLELARAAVNSGHCNQEPEPSRHMRTDVCLLCGCCTARKQQCKIMREAPTQMQQSIVNIIVSRQAPREITASDHVCMACWLRTKRKVQRFNRLEFARSQKEESNQTQPEQQLGSNDRSQPEIASQPFQEPSGTTGVVIPDYRRAANSNDRCVFPNCHSTTLLGISDKLRAWILNNHKYYLPHLACVCYDHLTSNSWETLYDSENSIDTFSVEHIQHVFSFVNAFHPTLDFDDLLNMDDKKLIIRLDS